MPTVSIEMFPGRTHEQKADLVAALTNAVVTSLGVEPDKVRIKIYEIPPWHSAQGGVLSASQESAHLGEQAPAALTHEP
jgi:4-oxalocrotonate tautomerase